MKPQRDEKRRKTTLRQKRLSTHDIIQSYADKLYKKMGAGIPISEIPISNPKELQKLIIHILKKKSLSNTFSRIYKCIKHIRKFS